MIASLLSNLGPWNWMALGMVLLVLEILLPGVFLLWIGIAALVVGTASLVLWKTSFWVWEVQVVVFLALSVIAAYAGRRIIGSGESQSDQPLLNRRSEQLIGRTATLKEPIAEGYGRIQLGDTLWRVTGPDMPAGSKVRVVSVKDSELVVTPSS